MIPKLQLLPFRSDLPADKERVRILADEVRSRWVRSALDGKEENRLLYDTLNRVIGCAGESEETRQAVLDLITLESCEPGPWGAPSGPHLGGSLNTAKGSLVGRVPMGN